MANDVVSIGASTTVIGQSALSPTAVSNLQGGQFLPSLAASTGLPAAKKPSAILKDAKPPLDYQALLAQLNKHLQSSGRPNQYKLDNSSGRNVIQEINPDTSNVIAEIPASEFKALAQELGISGLLIDAHA